MRPARASGRTARATAARNRNRNRTDCAPPAARAHALPLPPTPAPLQADFHSSWRGPTLARPPPGDAAHRSTTFWQLPRACAHTAAGGLPCRRPVVRLPSAPTHRRPRRPSAPRPPGCYHQEFGNTRAHDDNRVNQVEHRLSPYNSPTIARPLLASAPAGRRSPRGVQGARAPPGVAEQVQQPRRRLRRGRRAALGAHAPAGRRLADIGAPAGARSLASPLHATRAQRWPQHWRPAAPCAGRRTPCAACSPPACMSTRPVRTTPAPPAHPSRLHSQAAGARALMPRAASRHVVSAHLPVQAAAHAARSVSATPRAPAPHDCLMNCACLPHALFCCPAPCWPRQPSGPAHLSMCLPPCARLGPLAPLPHNLALTRLHARCRPTPCSHPLPPPLICTRRPIRRRASSPWSPASPTSTPAPRRPPKPPPTPRARRTRANR